MWVSESVYLLHEGNAHVYLFYTKVHINTGGGPGWEKYEFDGDLVIAGVCELVETVKNQGRM